MLKSTRPDFSSATTLTSWSPDEINMESQILEAAIGSPGKGCTKDDCVRRSGDFFHVVELVEVYFPSDVTLITRWRLVFEIHEHCICDYIHVHGFHSSFGLLLEITLYCLLGFVQIWDHRIGGLKFFCSIIVCA